MHSFSDDQYQEVLRLSLIMFLGFLIPYSTGNENRLLQHVNRRCPQSSAPTKAKFDPVECLLQMTLLDRLDQVSLMNNEKEYGAELGCLTDPRTEMAYHDFLHDGLLPLLSARSIDRVQVDILHLIAMVISPNPDVENSRTLSSSNHPCAQKAKQLMRHTVARNFHVHYGHRIELVRLLAMQQAVVLPPLSLDEDHYCVTPTAPLLLGALPHLHSSLLEFAKSSALCIDDCNAAYAALVALATQTRNVPLIAATWQILLHRIVENPIKHKCCREELPGRAITQFWPLSAHRVSLCSHSICGQLLAATIIRSRPDLAIMAVSSLAETIEWQVETWTADSDQEDDTVTPPPPCLLMALLFAARHALVVALRDDLEEEAVQTLADSGILLLQHPELGIRMEALRLLEVAFANAYKPVQSANALLDTIKKHRSRGDHKFLDGIDRLVRIMVQDSSDFARELSKQLLTPPEHSDVDGCLSKQESRLLATVFSNQPLVIPTDDAALQKQMSKCSSAVAMDLVAAALATRQTRYFNQMEEATRKSEQLLAYMAEKTGTRWDVYRMACHAMTIGDFCFASHAFRRLDGENSLNEEHFLWISALENVALAESLLGAKASKAIPDASCHLHTALSYIHHLHVTKTQEHNSNGVSYAFQSRYLLLRLDQLDLITVIRQLTRETRLTGAVPSKNTRHYQHLLGAVRSLQCLASRYRELNQQYGIRFCSGKSTTCLFAHQDLCQFLAKSTQTAFDEIFGGTSSALPSPKSQAIREDEDNKARRKSHVLLSKLIYELDRIVIPGMKNSMEPLVRAAAMLELLDALLMAPSPFPRDFFSPCVMPLAQLYLTALPSETLELGGKSVGQQPQQIVESYPYISSTVQIHGRIPVEIMSDGRRPISSVLLWCRVLFSSALDEEAPPPTNGPEHPVMSSEKIVSRLPNIQGPYDHFSMLADGRFHGAVELPPLVDEGWFVLETKLGCRDAAGAEWELYVDPASLHITIHCSRSI